MYLTKIKLNTKNKTVIYNMGNCEWVHKLLMESGFGNIQASNARKTIQLLYSMEEDTILMQSAIKPSISVNEGLFAVNPRTIDVSKLESICKNGNVIRFKCTCNPTKRTKEGKRVFLKTPEERSEWIKRTLLKNGATVLIEDQTPESTVFGIKSNKEDGTKHKIYAKTVTFAGALRIENGELFWKAVCEGIGREKAYGCGMIMIMR